MDISTITMVSTINNHRIWNLVLDHHRIGLFDDFQIFDFNRVRLGYCVGHLDSVRYMDGNLDWYLYGPGDWYLDGFGDLDWIRFRYMNRVGLGNTDLYWNL